MVRYIAPLLIALLVSACGSPAPPSPTAAPVAQPTTAVSPSPAAAVSPSPAAAVSPSAAPAVSPSAAASPSPAAAAPPVGSARVDVLKSANAAFASGDLTNASSLYERVLNTPPTGEGPAEQRAIDQFARFRAMISMLATGKEDQAKTELQAMDKAEPNGPLTRLGDQLWDQYSMVGGVRGACSQVQPQVGTQAGPTLQALQAMGVTVEANDLCKLPNA